MNRRRFLSSGLSALALTPWMMPCSAARAAPPPVDIGGAEVDALRVAPAGVGPLADEGRDERSGSASRVLIVVELRGGNDGLNTVVPVGDPLYRHLRPTLAIPSRTLLRLDVDRGLHPALAPLMPLWEHGEVAIVEGVGVLPGTSAIATTATMAIAAATAAIAVTPAAPLPASHFRAIRIWESGSGASEYRKGNWFDAVTDVAPFSRKDADAVSQPALSAKRTGSRSNRRTGGVDTPLVSMRFVERAAAAADVIVSGHADRAGVRFIRLTLDGFDTHHRQRSRHAELLAEFADGIAEMRARLTAAGRWDDVAIMTTSDFGRSAAENAEGGTDHGVAAPHFVMGGRVQGGIAGVMSPAIPAHGGSVVPVVDARRLYATVLDHWFGVSSAEVLGRQFDTLPLFT